MFFRIYLNSNEKYDFVTKNTNQPSKKYTLFTQQDVAKDQTHHDT